MLSSLAKQAAALARLGCILALLTGAAAVQAQQPKTVSPSDLNPSLRPLIQPRTAPTPLPVQRAVHITTAVINNKLTTFSFGSPVMFRTRDPLGVYTGRPLLAVGDVVSVDPTSHTVTLAIQRDLSSLPHVLELQAKKKGVYEKLLEREFPATRTFFVSRFTQILDGNRHDSRSARMETNRERLAQITIKLDDLHPGDRVSLAYRMNENPATPPAVYNISKQDPARRNYEADYRTMPKFYPGKAKAAATSPTLANNLLTSYPALKRPPLPQVLARKKAAQARLAQQAQAKSNH